MPRYSILLRKFNRAAIDRATFDMAKSSLRAELINGPGFFLLSISDATFYQGIVLMETHNLNATDAALLVLFQSYIGSFAPGSPVNFFLVTADERLIRAAQAEGIPGVNPETLVATDVASFLASLHYAPPISAE